MDAVVQQLANELQRQIEKLARDKQKLKQELARCQDEVDQTRNKSVTSQSLHRAFSS